MKDEEEYYRLNPSKNSPTENEIQIERYNIFTRRASNCMLYYVALCLVV